VSKESKAKFKRGQTVTVRGGFGPIKIKYRQYDKEIKGWFYSKDGSNWYIQGLLRRIKA
jgi:hypothetical protein